MGSVTRPLRGVTGGLYLVLVCEDFFDSMCN